MATERDLVPEQVRKVRFPESEPRELSSGLVRAQATPLRRTVKLLAVLQ